MTPQHIRWSWRNPAFLLPRCVVYVPNTDCVKSEGQIKRTVQDSNYVKKQIFEILFNNLFMNITILKRLSQKQTIYNFFYIVAI